MVFKKILMPVALAIAGIGIGFKLGIAAAPTPESEWRKIQSNPRPYLERVLDGDATKTFSEIRFEYGRNRAIVGGVGAAAVGLILSIRRGRKDHKKDLRRQRKKPYSEANNAPGDPGSP